MSKTSMIEIRHLAQQMRNHQIASAALLAKCWAIGIQLTLHRWWK